MSESVEFGSNDRLTDIALDQSIGRSTPDVEHERAVAIFDLLEENSFKPVGDDIVDGPYHLKLSVIDGKLVFAISNESGQEVAVHILSLGPFRRIVRDYFMICESYYEAIKTASTGQIETIDMARRLEPFGLYWIEEPLSPDNLTGYETLVREIDSTRGRGSAPEKTTRPLSSLHADPRANW